MIQLYKIEPNNKGIYRDNSIVFTTDDVDGKYCLAEDVRKFENAVLKYVKENSILPEQRDKFIKKWRLKI